MDDHDRGRAGGWGVERFPVGYPVNMVGGLYAGDHGVVAHQCPDLRPRSVWVLLNEGGLCLVPGKRVRHSGADPFLSDGDGSGVNRCAFKSRSRAGSSVPARALALSGKSSARLGAG